MRGRLIAACWGALAAIVVCSFTASAEEAKNDVKGLFLLTDYPAMQANSTYEIVRLLPSDGADYQYRIKNPREAFERVARESQLEFSN